MGRLKPLTATSPMISITRMTAAMRLSMARLYRPSVYTRLVSDWASHSCPPKSPAKGRRIGASR